MVKHKLFSGTKGRILFVSQTARVETPYLDPSVRYRCFNHAEVFSEEGFITDVISQRKLTTAIVENYDAFVFHRPNGGDPNLIKVLREIKKRGCPMVADYDDLIFSPDYALESSIFQNGVCDMAQTQAIFSNNYMGFSLFNNFTVSTAPLKDHVLELNPSAKVEIIRNGLSNRMVESFDMRPTLNDSGVDKRIKIISYLSGTASHNRDFGFVAETLSAFLKSRDDFRLLIAGPLELPEGFPRRCLLRLPHREYRDFFSMPRVAYVNIAPLKPQNVFNECKSGLKFFESAIWGVPSITSPLEDFMRFKESPGINIASTEEEWFDALNNYCNPEYRETVTKNLISYCRKKCMAREQSLKLLQILQGGVS